MTKRQLQAIETKRKIFESAYKLFSEKGFDQITMDEITSAVGLTPGAFCRYFSTKQEILAIVYSMEACVKDGLEYVNVIYRYMVQSDAFEKSMNNPERIHFKIGGSV